MIMAAIIPPWLQPPSDPGAQYISAFHAGSAVAMEQARLQQEAERSAMAAAEKAQIAQQDALQQQQKIEIEKSYNQSQIGLKKQMLDQAQQKIAQTAQAASRKFAAQEQIKQAIAGGMPADEAYLRFGGEAFNSMAGVGALSKQVRDRANPFVPTGMIEPVTGSPMVQRAPGQWERGLAADKGPSVSTPMNPDQPWGARMTGRFMDPKMRPYLGTNAPPLAGNPANVSSQYKTPAEVGAAYKAHKITRAEATRILKGQFSIE